MDSRRTVLVWEPGRIVPSYAVQETDILATVQLAESADIDLHPVAFEADGLPVLDPSTGFAAHTCEGETVSLVADGVVLAGAGFRPLDADLGGHVFLDFAAFDEWLEEDEPIVGHPHDPFARIDVRRSSSPVQVDVDGVRLADSTSARLLFETGLPPRFYLPRDDVRMELLHPSDRQTTCAYKGHASYWSVEVEGHVHPDLAWTYEQPLADARDVGGYIAFFDERVDVILDGKRRARPITPWS